MCWVDTPSEIKQCLKNSINVIDLSSYQQRSPEYVTYSNGKIEKYAGSQILVHPMCGSEKSGSENSSANLFEGNNCIVTTEDVSENILKDIIEIFGNILKMNLVYCTSANEHNRIVSRTSHVLQ